MDIREKYIGNTTKYCGVQGFFWMLYDAVMAYISVYLLAKGLSNSAIGVLIAISCAISVVVQPLVGGLLDRSRKITIHMAMIFYSVAMVLGAVVLIVGTDNKIINLLIYGVFITFIQSMLSLINSMGMHYIDQGIKLNFGIARGAGSIFYAVASVSLGKLINMWGIVVIPVSIVIMTTLLVICTLIFRYPEIDKEYLNNKTVKAKENKVRVNFFKKYPKYSLLQVGMTLVFVSHNITCNFAYQIMENVGGGESEMGIFLGISAIVEIPFLFTFNFILKKINAGNLLRISTVFFALKVFLTFLSTSVIALYFVQILQMFAYAVYAGASVYYADEIMEEEDRVKGQSFMALTTTLGTIIGSLVGGAVLDSSGVKILLLVGTFAGAIGMLITQFSIEKKDKNCN